MEVICPGRDSSLSPAQPPGFESAERASPQRAGGGNGTRKTTGRAHFARWLRGRRTKKDESKQAKTETFSALLHRDAAAI